MRKLRIVILRGGPGFENSVSLSTGNNFIKILYERGPALQMSYRCYCRNMELIKYFVE